MRIHAVHREKPSSKYVSVSKRLLNSLQNKIICINISDFLLYAVVNVGFPTQKVEFLLEPSVRVYKKCGYLHFK